MDHSASGTFISDRPRGAPGMAEAVALARRTVSGVTDLPFDSVSHCSRDADGTWTVVVDVIESPARLGDNDLVAAFEVAIDTRGDILSCSRTRRYRREEGDAA
ncbi:MAG: gas vesicle protein GvpO [Pseudomonadota bacterium]